jgi:GAF domain-containing protein
MSPERTAADAHLVEVEAEQAALRRIAALLARSVPAEEVFDAVVDEVRSLMGVDAAALVRYEADKTATLLAVSAEADARVDLPEKKLSTEGHNVMALVLGTGRPARVDDYAKATGGEHVRRYRDAGVRSGAGAPVRLRERMWGVLAVYSMHGRRYPSRLASILSANIPERWPTPFWPHQLLSSAEAEREAGRPWTL